MKTAGVSLPMLAGIALGAVAPDPGASPDPTQLVTPLSSSSDVHLPAPWQIITLPKIPRHTQYEVVTIDGRRVVKATAEASYANVVHTLNADVTATPQLQFSWRVDRFPAESDLTVKSGDDLAAKVCVLFDLPLSQLGFLDRLKIELGRRLFKLDLPAATVCYVWDRTLPPGTWLPNVYTDRVRMLVLRSAAAGQQGQWFDEQRDLRADFQQAFGAETRGTMPPVQAVAFATDADSTGDGALAYFGDITLVAP